VNVDVRPGSLDNHINVGSSGLVPVALLGSADVDAASIDPASVTFAGAHARTRKDGSTIFTLVDVDGDGFTDLSLGFDSETLQLQAGDQCAPVSGNLTDGRPFKGSAAVSVTGSSPRAFGRGQLRPRDGSSTSVMELRANSVWPNPAGAGAVLNLTLATDAPASLEVWTVTGRLVSRRDLGAMGAGSHAVDLSETRTLPNGVYFVRILQSSRSSGTRVIVQH